MTLIDERLGELARRHATALSAIDAIDQHGEQFRQLVDSARAELLDALAAKAAAAAEQQKLEANKILLDLERHAREVRSDPGAGAAIYATLVLRAEADLFTMPDCDGGRKFGGANASLASSSDEIIGARNGSSASSARARSTRVTR